MRHDTIHRGRQVHVERRPLDPRTALARLRAGSVEVEPEPCRHVDTSSTRVPAPRPLAADIGRLIHPERRHQFDAALFDGVVL